MIEQSHGQLASLVSFLKQLQKVPYLASRNLYIVAQYFLDSDIKEIDIFIQSLKDLKTNLEKCKICWAWKEKTNFCSICNSPKRDKGLICVVETWRDLISIEKAGGYTGVYHVLGGLISPLDGLGPEDLTIKQLVERVMPNSDSENSLEVVSCKEIVFAFNQTPEGEVTASYINSKLKNLGIKISSLARGLPVGSIIESMDRLTVYKALAERRVF